LKRRLSAASSGRHTAASSGRVRAASSGPEAAPSRRGWHCLIKLFSAEMCTFMQKFTEGLRLRLLRRFLQKSKISAISAERCTLLQISAEISEICKFLQKFQKYKISAEICREVHPSAEGVQISAEISEI
jgi:hypothetical protein